MRERGMKMGLEMFKYFRMAATVVAVAVAVCGAASSRAADKRKGTGWDDGDAPGRNWRLADGGGKGTLNTIALAVGVMFVALAGSIFATTTWRLMPSGMKVLSILGLAAASFGASLLAERTLHIEKTAMACHILGSTFLFLLFVAAGYFGFLGAVFAAGESGWWCVLGMGVMTAMAAMGLGLRRFQAKAYRGITMACALASAAFFLTRYARCFLEKLVDGADGGLAVSAFTFFSMAVLAGGSGFFFWKFENPMAESVFSLTLAALVHYGALYAEIGLMGRGLLMAAAMTLCFFAHRLPIGKIGRSLCGMPGDWIFTAALLGDVAFLALVRLFMQGDIAAQVQMLTGMFLLGFAAAEWSRWNLAVRAAAPAVMWYTVVPAASILESMVPGHDWLVWLTFLYACGFAVRDAVRRDVYGIAILAIDAVMLALAEIGGDASWCGAWALLAGFCGCQFVWRGQYGKAAAALAVLVLNALSADRLMDMLILEGFCLIACLLAHQNGSRRWSRIFGAMMPAAALYGMKDFWTEIAWWVYLLIAGIGLILFAAVREKKS